MERVLPDIDAHNGDRGDWLRHAVLLGCGAFCQLRLPAGQEHGRTIPLAALRLEPHRSLFGCWPAVCRSTAGQMLVVDAGFAIVRCGDRQ
jgi:hypothetical protein